MILCIRDKYQNLMSLSKSRYYLFMWNTACRFDDGKVVYNYLVYSFLALNAPITTKVVYFSRLLKCLRSLYAKQCGPRSDCSYMSSLFWVHAVCFYTQFVSNASQLFAVADFIKRHFQMHFFLGALRVRDYMEIHFHVV